MKIEEGKFYRTRSALVVGPMHFEPDARGFDWRGASGVTMRIYNSDGDVPSRDPKMRLIAEAANPDGYEWGEEPEAAIGYAMNAKAVAARGKQPQRATILREALTLTTQAREAEYGPPRVNFACAAALKTAFRAHAKRDISPAEMEAIDMVLTKLGRIATGAAKRDNYVDGAGYLALAGEIALDGM